MKKKIIRILIIYIIIFVLLIVNTSFVNAIPTCVTKDISTNDNEINFTIPDNNSVSLDPSRTYQIIDPTIGISGQIQLQFMVNKDRLANIKIIKDRTNNNSKLFVNDKLVTVNSLSTLGDSPGIFNFNLIKTGEEKNPLCELDFTVTKDDTFCKLTHQPIKLDGFRAGDKITFSGLTKMYEKNIAIVIKDSSLPNNKGVRIICTTTNKNGAFSETYSLPDGPSGQWTFNMYYSDTTFGCYVNRVNSDLLCSSTFNYNAPEPSGGTTTTQGVTNICKFSSDKNCDECMKKPGVPTPFGCIETEPQKLIEKLLRIAISIAGGIAFLMIVVGGFNIMMSGGNPEKLNGGKEIITSAISGLLLIAFSVVILKIIGVDIFKLPGLGG